MRVAVWLDSNEKMDRFRFNAVGIRQHMGRHDHGRAIAITNGATITVLDGACTQILVISDGSASRTES